MTIYRPAGRKIYTIKVPTAAGEWLPYSTGTKNLATARRMERMVEHLGPRGERAWDALAVVHTNIHSVPSLYDLYGKADKDVAKLRALLVQIDLASLVDSFLAAAHCSADTKAHYKALIRRLIPEGVEFPAERFTAITLQQTIDEANASPSTKRKLGAAFRTFGNWLVRRGYLRDNPMRQVALPPAGKPRTKFLETPDAIRLADAQPSPYREYAALLAGSGIEVSVALTLRVRDVDTKHREIRAAGTKTHTRDRIVRVADWAWPYVRRAIKGKESDALVFEAIPDRWIAADVHRAAIKRLTTDEAGKGIASSPFVDYTMRDHRHTYAVRAMRAGAPPDLIARQLGHSTPNLLLSVYGRFQPTQPERNRWEKAASSLDKSRGKPSIKPPTNGKRKPEPVSP